MATLFTEGSNVTFGIGDSPIGTAILEGETIKRGGKVTEIRDANGLPTGKTVVRDWDTVSFKAQLTGATGPTIKIGNSITLAGDGFSYMVTEASAVYSQGGYAYQNIVAMISSADIA